MTVSKPLEVRAVTSFGAFRQNKIYEIDLEDDRMLSLLGVGYLEPTSDLEDDDAGLDRASGLVMGSDSGGAAVHRDGVAGLPEASKELSDVSDRAEPGDDSAHRASKRVRGGKTIGVTDSGGGSDPGSVGDA
jgi:hypothetical protein